MNPRSSSKKTGVIQRLHKDNLTPDTGVGQTDRCCVGGGTYQSERAKHRQALDIGQTQFHQTHGDNEAVENVPTNLKTHGEGVGAGGGVCVCVSGGGGVKEQEEEEEVRRGAGRGGKTPLTTPTATTTATLLLVLHQQLLHLLLLISELGGVSVKPGSSSKGLCPPVSGTSPTVTRSPTKLFYYYYFSTALIILLAATATFTDLRVRGTFGLT